MAQPNYKSYLSSLKKVLGHKAIKDFPKMIYIWGPSEFLILKTAEALKAHFSKLSSPAIATLEPSDLSIEAMEAICDQKSMFEPETFYILRRLEQHPSYLNLLKSISSAGSIQNYLCLCHLGKPNSKLLEQVKALGCEQIVCTEPKTYELAPFVKALALKQHLHLDQDATQLILDTQGADLFKIENEINNLASSFPKDSHLTSRQIHQHLGVTKKDHIFQLEYLLTGQKYPQAYALVQELIQRGEKPPAILAIIANHCRKALSIATLLKNSHQVGSISSRLNLPQSVVKRYMGLSKRPIHSWVRTLKSCQSADIAIKSTSKDSTLILFEVIATHEAKI